MKRCTPMKRTGFKSTAPSILRLAEPTSKVKFPQPGPAKVKPVRRMRAKQRPVTAAEKALWDRMATEVGCIACCLDGRLNTHVSIHHIDGRTKPSCHRKVLPICAGHHQDGTGEDKTLIAVHPYKKQFERRYGTQYELLALVMEKLKVEQ
jgi:hypothetical protein